MLGREAVTARDKTIALITLAEALHTATLVGDPAPVVRRLGDWMRAPIEVGDLVLEISAMHRGPDRSRIGEVVRITKIPGDREVEILMFDPPCGNVDSCDDKACIHRMVWTDAWFIRLPSTPAILRGIDPPPGSGSGVVRRDDLIAALADSGIRVRGT